MKVKTLLSFAAALCCAAAFSMSAQAQLKIRRCMPTFLTMQQQKIAWFAISPIRL